MSIEYPKTSQCGEAEEKIQKARRAVAHAERYLKGLHGQFDCHLIPGACEKLGFAKGYLWCLEEQGQGGVD